MANEIYTISGSIIRKFVCEFCSKEEGCHACDGYSQCTKFNAAQEKIENIFKNEEFISLGSICRPWLSTKDKAGEYHDYTICPDGDIEAFSY